MIWAPFGPVASASMSASSSNTGSVVSCTVTVNDPVPTLFEKSVPVHSTRVSPMGNTELAAGVHTIATSRSTASSAVTSNGTTAP